MKLSPEEIQERLIGLDGWREESGILMKSYRFSSYMDGIEFVNRVAETAERHHHHPDLLLTYGRVDVLLKTHDEDGITDKDFRLAAAIEELAG
ncbi:pterin-4-alpha-carbinolamine dehydratase [Melghirimyces profundicolus]|uniref:Putative pterin-4-alpha-carbinolamine dehydratase n=1 Tax=Melghirimyces profundicolus TaxID=1242148 RepID=A0A2T6C9L7_9BACL|nr:4a-hydroxytetrahydrobiopterin dehydratase [Melghirimyces profundicolus]PTX65014.1 pterin-4-alpha-carbinolamine dehydratase [Melghirimyces profundicolus]